MGSEALQIWLDSDLGPMTQVGTLAHDRGQVRFRYNAGWLQNPSAFALDPGLSLDDAPFFPRPEAGNFGIFLDSSPDRWGQTLMKRREALAAKDERRQPRHLYAWDFLIGVQDLTRQGALRFRFEDADEFLGAEKFAAPPVVRLRELEEIAGRLTSRRIDDLDALRRWLAVLVAPGASLGGARPKANFTEEDSSLWIGKFPARDDDRDIGAWELLAHKLGKEAGIDLPPARLVRLNSEHHTFCVQRFDRAPDASGVTKRRFYASAMTLLGKDQSEGSSYLELAQFLHAHGSPKEKQEDLKALFRRVAFNVAVGNRDDHLRNHGFVLGPDGWRLAPAFDVNPNVDKAEHVLNIDDTDNRPTLKTVRETAAFYGVDGQEANEIIERVVAATSRWRDVAQQLGIGSAEIESSAGAFAATEEERASPTKRRALR